MTTINSMTSGQSAHCATSYRHLLHDSTVDYPSDRLTGRHCPFSQAMDCPIFDVQNVSDGPVARIRLPERICGGTHATWAVADVLGV